jgi:3-hydroxy-9,10-secoandrosta-1,3,5(10)-triene-9,17-dione monooxygenase reductase component
LILHPGIGYGNIPNGWYVMFWRKERPVKATIDTLEFRRVLGHFPTGVAIVTALDAARRPTGLSVGSFFSISLVPPLIGLCAAKQSKSWPQIKAAGSFCVNILAEDQQELCAAFARSGTEKFIGVKWDTVFTDSPSIHGSLAWIDCDIQQIHEAGDHEICVAAVKALDVAREARPLVFFRGGYRCARGRQPGRRDHEDRSRPAR